MRKSTFTLIIKFIFAFGILYWLIDSGKLDFGLMKGLFSHPERIAIAFILLMTNVLIVTWRWRHILHANTDKILPIGKITEYNWIGLFFNSILPGSVTGDFVKIFYVRDIDQKLSKRFLLGTVVVDRFIGLFGLIFMLGFFSLLHYNELTSISDAVKNLIHINLALLAGIFLGFIALFFFQDIPRKIVHKLERITLLKGPGHKLADLWERLCSLRSRILLLTFISIFVHMIAVVTMWILGEPFAEGNFKLSEAFSFVPIGLVSIAIPIAPSGLGVGHAVFHKLFALFGVNNGASLFNLYFLIQLVINLLGVIPFLLHRKKASKAMESV